MPDLHENSEELYGSGKRTVGNALRGTRLAIKGASRAVQAAGNAVKAARAGIKAGETVGRILVMILQALGITGIAVLGGLFLCFVIAWVFYVQLAPSASSGMAKNTYDGTVQGSGFASSSRVGSIEIPEPYGDLFLVENMGADGWYFWNSKTEKFTVKRVAPGTDDRIVYDRWVADGAPYKGGIAAINGRYMIACVNETYGYVGDAVDFILDDGQVLPCIVADQKRASDAGRNKWGHKDGRNVIEFITDPDTYYKYRGITKDGWHPEWKDRRTVRCDNLGVMIDCGH